MRQKNILVSPVACAQARLQAILNKIFYPNFFSEIHINFKFWFNLTDFFSESNNNCMITQHSKRVILLKKFIGGRKEKNTVSIRDSNSFGKLQNLTIVAPKNWGLENCDNGFFNLALKYALMVINAEQFASV